MNYLNRIIAINSFLLSKGRIDVYDIHGGSVILGTNTVGKSSFLRTQLLFYGAKPENISSLSGNRNLTNFYFKTDSSYLVFEYIKDGRPNLVVAFSSDRQSVSYRFVTGEFDETLFTHFDEVTGKSRFINNQDLKSHIRKHNRHCSPILKYQEYTSVIQSGKFERGSGLDGKRRNELRHRFSICPKDVSIAGVDRIALSIIDSDPSIETIKRLLANDVADLAKEIKKNVTDRASSIDSHNRDIRIVDQAQKFQEKRPMVQSLMSLKQAILKNNSRLKGLKYEAVFLQEKQQQELTKLDKEAHETYLERTRCEDDFEVSRRKFNDNIGRLESQLGLLTSDIDDVEQRYQSYQREDIESSGTLANQIPSISSELASLRSRLKELSGEHERIISHYDEELRQFKDEQGRYLDGERALCNVRLEELRSSAKSINDDLHSALDAITERFKNARSSLWVKKNELSGKVAGKKAQADNPNSPEIERVTQSLEDSSKALQKINAKHRELSDADSKLQSLYQELWRERESKLTQKSNIEAENEKVGNQIVELGKELTVVESMLYFRVLEQDPDKAELMAKTLKESVLKAKIAGELNIDVGNNNLLGIDFDFAKFEAVRPDTKETIEAKLKAATSAKNQNDEKVSFLDREISSLSDRISENEQKRNQLSINLISCGRDLVSEEASRSGFVDKLEILKAEIVAELEQELSDLRHELGATEEKITNIDKEEEAEKAKAREISESKVKENDGAISSANESLRAEEERVKVLIQEKAKEIERNKEISLNEAGAPTLAIQETKSSIAKLEKGLIDARLAKDKYDKYMLWKEESYARLPQKKQDAESLSKQLFEQRRSLQDLIETEVPAIKALKSKEADLEGKAKSLRHDLNVLNGLLGAGDSMFSQLESKKYFDRSPPSVEEIQGAVSKHLNENADFFNQGKQDFGSLIRTFRSYPELVGLCSELLASEGFLDVGSANEWLDSIASVDLLLNGSLEQEIQARLDSFKALGDHLINLNSQLDEVDSSLSLIGRRVTKHMNESSRQFDAIGELSAKITSKISHLPFKKALVRTVGVINSKKGLAPDKAFLNAVTDAVSSLQRDATDIDIAKMINIAIHLENKEGKIEQATTDAELLKISSEGMSFLILVMIFVAIKNSIAHNKGVELLWSLDEVGRIHPDNVKIISEILKSEGISFLCAGPSIDAQVASLFENIYKVVQDKETGLDFIVKTEALPTATDIFNAVLEGSEGRRD